MSTVEEEEELGLMAPELSTFFQPVIIFYQLLRPHHYHYHRRHQLTTTTLTWVAWAPSAATRSWARRRRSP